MKKRVFLIAALAAAVFTSSNVQAQDENMSSDREYKFSEGDKNIEVNFTPLGARPISISNIRFRYFLSNDLAVRVGLNVNINNTTTPRVDSVPNIATITDPNDLVGVETEDVSSTFGFGISAGIEKHFEGTDRLSPYVGGEIGFATVSTTSTDELLDVSTAPTTPTDQAALEDTYESETTGGSTSFSVAAVIGADWYFSKDFYLGTEIGLGLFMTNTMDDEVTNPSSPGFAGPPNTGDGLGNPTSTTVNGSTMNVSPYAISAIRLGFLF